jgi:hypothetical protein
LVPELVGVGRHKLDVTYNDLFGNHHHCVLKSTALQVQRHIPKLGLIWLPRAVGACDDPIARRGSLGSGHAAQNSHSVNRSVLSLGVMFTEESQKLKRV